MANVTINLTGLQVNYGSSTGVIELDRSINVDGQQLAWQVGTSTVFTASNISTKVNAFSQSYQYQLGLSTLDLEVDQTIVGQQVNWILGGPLVVLSDSTTVSVIGQEYDYAVGIADIQESSPSSNPIVIQPGPGVTFRIEGCPTIDTKIMVESLCGQSLQSQLYKYNAVINYNAAHTYGAS